MNLNRIIVITAAIVFVSATLSAQEYVYPNKKVTDAGLLEYRRYTPKEAMAYEKGSGSFAPLLITGWSEEERLTEDETSYAPKTLAIGDTVFCTYGTLNRRIPKFISSYDAGITWNPVIALEDTTHTRSHYYPEIANNGADMIVGTCFYRYDEHGYNLGYFQSSDRGETWSQLIPIFPYYNFDQSNYGSLCNSGQRLYFAYNEYNHDSLYVLISPAWGQYWNGRGVNVAYLGGTPQPMTVRASGDNVYLVWVKESPRPIAVHYSRSTNRGQTWADEIDLASDPWGAQVPFIAVQDTHVVVCWMGYKYSPYAFTGDLFIKQSFDGGETWGEEQVLTDLHKVWMGEVFIEDSLIVVTWQDDRYMDDNNNEAFVRYSFDNGLTWTDEERLSFGDYDSHSPIACKTDSKIHVFWGDMRREAPGLYYCANDLTTSIDDNNLLPTKHELLSAYPNPFNSTTLINYSNLKGGDIEIYDITGRLVTRIDCGGRQEGKVTWDATDASGEKVCSGIYFARARIAAGAVAAKLIYLK